ncbi:hypothetical protein WL38_20300 [Burkholderia ubonensis]|uniref:hypothetical protein n=1 Tax=Burkholderia ubonensis TaxID=101571 RepID=UPI00075ACC1E|nr:hypothetical protein [Burkholderia ubonensis]KWB64159.1 hypothetical protein WL38_20300 [Burkholderia ubonensis]
MLFWIAVIVGAVVVLFVGSAVIGGIMESNQRRDTREKAGSLTDVNVLQKMIMKEMDERHDVPLVCWYNGAISYRLAEARDLKIEKADAVELSNDQYLVHELVKHGFDPKAVVAGLARIVYDSPLSPTASFDAAIEACTIGNG